jgi:hypothetical protein
MTEFRSGGPRPGGWEAGPAGLKLEGGGLARGPSRSQRAPRSGAEDSAPEAWPSEVLSFLGPITSLPPSPGPSRGSSASAAPLSPQGMREALSSHPSPSAILQSRVPGRGAAVAATIRQPAVSTDPQWPAEPAGSIPPLSRSLRRTPPGGPGPGRAPRRIGFREHRRGAGSRGSAPSRGRRILLLPPPGL